VVAWHVGGQLVHCGVVADHLDAGHLLSTGEPLETPTTTQTNTLFAKHLVVVRPGTLIVVVVVVVVVDDDVMMMMMMLLMLLLLLLLLLILLVLLLLLLLLLMLYY